MTKTRIIVSGCMGKMSTAFRELATQDNRYEVVSGIDTQSGELNFPIYNYADIASCDVTADVLVDFSLKENLTALLQYAKTRKIPLVLGTTGYAPEQLAAIAEAAHEVAIFQSANMSLGIGVLVNLLQRAAKVLYSNANFDIEIIEKHHNQKIDAPSGTALLLADGINSALDGQLTYKYDRSDAFQKRDRAELGIHALRGGTIVGQHEVVFAGKDEMLSFTHEAHSRGIFAAGALQAVAFVVGKPHGLYNMQDLINAVTD